MSVADLFSVDLEQQGVFWRWRRRLWQWEEEMLAECRTLLLDVLLFAECFRYLGLASCSFRWIHCSWCLSGANLAGLF
ncbi:hypothetical protein MtrunA17_Chr3g0111331 [Medicago truncatula]|uniref:Uncharacterized protein n=1 Tax=Medicago truncatula TaxID=3880 RepID=A0A396IW28_MEDTR|nr:hypothetical protein MtrunA17_Chr3g0111331 [Medicago truncatula]